MAIKGKKAPAKAKTKKAKRVVKVATKKTTAKKKPLSAKAKKPAIKKAKSGKAKSSVKAKPRPVAKKAKPVKKRVLKKASKPAKKTVSKTKLTKKKPQGVKSSQSVGAGKATLVKNNVTEISDFLKHSKAKKGQKETMSETVSKPKTKRAKTAAQVGQQSQIGMAGVRPYQQEPGEEYMNEVQKAHFRRLLGQWKLELMQEVDRTVDHMQNESANYPDMTDRAAREEEFSLELRTRDRERKLIKKIEEALAKMDQNEYGYCESCGVEIGVRRLEARPTATLCIDCKTLDEIKERQMGG